MVLSFMKVHVTAAKLLFFSLKTWKCATDSSQFHQKQENSNFEKHTGRNVVVASCSSTNHIKGIDSFVPKNKELRKPWPIGNWCKSQLSQFATKHPQFLTESTTFTKQSPLKLLKQLSLRAAARKEKHVRFHINNDDFIAIACEITRALFLLLFYPLVSTELRQATFGNTSALAGL